MTFNHAKRLFAYTLAIALVTAVLGEISLRILHHFRPVFIFHDDSYNRWRGKPGTRAMGIRLNSLGFMDVEFGPKQPGVYRIAALGDSFAYGVVPYRQNYLTVLEDNLNAIGTVEVLNMGIAGIGPKDYFDLLVREGLSQEPDAVLVTFFIGNDITQGAGQAKERSDLPWGYSFLWSALRYLILIRPFVEPPTVNPRGDPNKFEFCDDCPRWPVGQFLAIETTYAENFFTNVREAQSNIADALQPLLDMKAVCDAKGIQFFVVLAPDQLQIDKELVAVVMERGYQPYARYWDPEFPNRIILEILRSNGIEVLDLLPSFQAAGELKPLYLPRNTHWNIAGNRLAADQISHWLAKHVLSVPAGR